MKDNKILKILKSKFKAIIHWRKWNKKHFLYKIIKEICKKININKIIYWNFAWEKWKRISKINFKFQEKKIMHLF